MKAAFKGWAKQGVWKWFGKPINLGIEEDHVAIELEDLYYHTAVQLLEAQSLLCRENLVARNLRTSAPKLRYISSKFRVHRAGRDKPIGRDNCHGGVSVRCIQSPPVTYCQVIPSKQLLRNPPRSLRCRLLLLYPTAEAQLLSCSLFKRSSYESRL